MSRFSIARVRLYHLKIPLRSPFVQSHNTRLESDNLVCEIVLDDGTVGYGEGVPRDYVTGETPEGSWEVLCRALGALRDFRATGDLNADIAAIPDFVLTLVPDEGPTIRNAARAAVEIALLDCVARSRRVPLSDHLARRAGTTPGSVATHSLVIGKQQAEDPELLSRLQDRYGFRAAKVKVGFGLDEDLRLLRQVRDVLGPDVELRVDANRKWDLDEAIAHVTRFASLGVVAVEDPLRAESLEVLAAKLAAFRRASSMLVVLDEPVRTLAELEALAAHGIIDAVSIRVSKCGGLVASGRMATFCRDHGILVQVGCQAGETAILSAAGRLLAHSVGDVRFLEGSNEHLKWRTEDTIAREDLNYGYGAQSSPLVGDGLGVTIVVDQLRRFAGPRIREI